MPAGRPTKYKPEYVEEAYRQSLLGKTDTELAQYFDISEATLYKWKNEYPEFSESIQNGKDKADGVVVKSLYDEAKSGNIQAQRFWLMNRQKNWKEKQHIEQDRTIKVIYDHGEGND
jgi:transposase-like protein